jgi:ribonuclease HI
VFSAEQSAIIGAIQSEKNSRYEIVIITDSISTIMFSAEQSAIIGAIQSEKNSRYEIVIITDSISTIMAAESRTPTKNPKTRTIRKMFHQKRPRITLLWVPSHKGIPGIEKADQAAKKALEEDIPTTERYPLDDLKKWLTEDTFKKRDQRWKNGNNEIK